MSRISCADPAGGDLKEKAFYSLRSSEDFIFALAFECRHSTLSKNKALPLSREGFFFCRGGRIRTCDPLVPNQMR
jgi:hypothetical protein